MKDQTAIPATLPAEGYVRIRQIIGDPKAKPPIPAIVPIGRSSWWKGVALGKYPPAVKLAPRTTAWCVEDIRTLLVNMKRG